MLKEFGLPGGIESREDLLSPCKYYKSRNGIFWVITDKNAIMGTIAIYEIIYNNQKVGFLKRFFIQKKYRCKGLGDNILKAIEEHSKNKGWKWVVFGVDVVFKKARGFYINSGYTEFYKKIPSELTDDKNEWFFRKKL